MIAAGVKLDKLATQPNDLLCVNIGKQVRTHRRPEETEEGLMRAQSVDGAQWIPARLLEIMPGQVVKTTLGSKHTSDMIANALRLPAENAGLIENEGLEIIGVKSNNGGKQPLVNLPVEQVIVRSMQYTDFPQGVAGLFCQRKIDRGSAETLAQPKLNYHNTSKTPELGHWNLQNIKFRNGATIGRLHMLEMPDSSLQGCTLKQAREALSNQLKTHGLQIQFPTEGEWIAERDLVTLESNKGAYVPASRSVEWILERFFNNVVKNSADVSVILIPNKNYDLYALAKRLADFNGHHCLFAIGKKFVRTTYGAKFDSKFPNFDRQLLSNLALKVNIKMGGENHHFDEKELNNVWNRNSEIAQLYSVQILVIWAQVARWAVLASLVSLAASTATS
jgi:eukaryotic translation initiation factor 2C